MNGGMWGFQTPHIGLIVKKAGLLTPIYLIMMIIRFAHAGSDFINAAKRCIDLPLHIITLHFQINPRFAMLVVMVMSMVIMCMAFKPCIVKL